MNVFITGTDTGAGKTHFSAAVLRACGRRGVGAIGMKPIASGAEETPAGWHNDDVAALRAAATVSAPDADINPYLFALPASPHIAADAAGAQPGRHARAVRRGTAAQDGGAAGRPRATCCCSSRRSSRGLLYLYVIVRGIGRLISRLLRVDVKRKRH